MNTIKTLLIITSLLSIASFTRMTGMDKAVVEIDLTIHLLDGESVLSVANFNDLKKLSAINEIFYAKDGKAHAPGLTRLELEALTKNLPAIKEGGQALQDVFMRYVQTCAYQEFRALITAANYFGIEPLMTAYFSFLENIMPRLEKHHAETYKIFIFRLLLPMDLVFPHKAAIERVWLHAVKQEKGFLVIIKNLIEHHGIDINAENRNKQTALLIALLNHGCQDMIELLLEHKAHVNIADSSGFTPLFWAATGGHKKNVVALLNHGATVDTEGSYLTALWAAVDNGHTEIVQVLLEHRANVEILDQWGYTMLIRAAQHNREALVKLLLQYGAQVNRAEAYSGTTALSIAKDEGHARIVSLLLENGAR